MEGVQVKCEVEENTYITLSLRFHGLCTFTSSTFPELSGPTIELPSWAFIAFIRVEGGCVIKMCFKV